MFDDILKFFIKNSRLNYFLFIVAIIIGIYSYIKSPKEIFPSFSLDMISVSGSYMGASIDMLDKMAVKDIEDEIKGIEGIKTMTTIINPGRFNIVLELSKGVDKYETSDLVKDAISRSTQNLPTDMTMPSVNVLSIQKELLSIAISSKKLDHNTLLKEARRLKDKIDAIPKISSIKIYGDSDKYYDVVIDRKKIEALGLDLSRSLSAISKLSYIFPIGKIKDSKKGFYYLSTFNGPKDAKGMLDSHIRVGNKSIYLKDIATVKKRHIDSSTLFLLNSNEAIDLSISQSSSGDAITISKKIHQLIKKLKKQNPDIEYKIHNDRSIFIKDRLNIIGSNILLGIILITLVMWWLINLRIALIISLGIPTAFVMGAFVLYYLGYSINMISLIGVLIALGIIVDDAIVVSENIQQHIERGIPPQEAAYRGALEMAKPVTIASLTTLFALLPMLMMSGVMGLVIKLIPITISILLITSLIEAFIFLPIHAAHTLKANIKTRSWTKINSIYQKVINYLINHSKLFIVGFIVGVLFLSGLLLKSSKFQMFPTFDASTLSITLKASPNSDISDINEILKKIQSDLFKEKERFSFNLIGSVSGYRRSSTGVVESYPYVGMMILELEKLKPQNFVDRFITPYLSFYYDSNGRVRDKKSQDIAKELREFIKKKNYKERYHLEDIDVGEAKAGSGKSEIKIGFVSSDDEMVVKEINRVENALRELKGITTVTDNIQYGIDEIKLKINGYGGSLGLDEQSLGVLLSNTYLDRKSAIVFDREDLLEIRVSSSDKDSLDALKNYQLTLANGQEIALRDVVTFITKKSFEKLIKDFGEKNFYIYANVDGKNITATEALEKIKPILDEVRSKGIKIKLKGENEEKNELRSDMIAATLIAIMLILVALLYLFNSFSLTFMMLSVIPFSILGVLIGHKLLGLNLSMPSIIGILGLSGIVINDGIIMIMTLKNAKDIKEITKLAASRFRPIVLTSITTLIGLATLIFFPTGQAAIFQPMAISLGFGLAWGTVLNLLYLPTLFTLLSRKKLKV